MVFVQNRSNGCQHVRLWCVRTSKWPRNRVRNRHVHSFVVICDFLSIGVPMFKCWLGKPEHTPLHNPQHSVFVLQSPARTLLLEWQLCFRKPTRGLRKFLHSHFTQSPLDNKRRFKNSSLQRWVSANQSTHLWCRSTCTPRSGAPILLKLQKPQMLPISEENTALHIETKGYSSTKNFLGAYSLNSNGLGLHVNT